MANWCLVWPPGRSRHQFGECIYNFNSTSSNVGILLGAPPPLHGPSRQPDAQNVAVVNTSPGRSRSQFCLHAFWALFTALGQILYTIYCTWALPTAIPNTMCSTWALPVAILHTIYNIRALSMTTTNAICSTWALPETILRTIHTIWAPSVAILHTIRNI